MTKEARNALLRAHQHNIDRYCRLLTTPLTDTEREYLHNRIAQERHALERLVRGGVDDAKRPLEAASLGATAQK